MIEGDVGMQRAMANTSQEHGEALEAAQENRVRKANFWNAERAQQAGLKMPPSVGTWDWE